MLATIDLETAREQLAIEHQEIRALINTLSDEAMERAATVTHGLYWGQRWSFRDLLAHLTTYEVLALDAYEAAQRGEWHWSLDILNDAELSKQTHYDGVSSRSHLTLNELILAWDNTQQKLTIILNSFTDDDRQRQLDFQTPAAEPTDIGGLFQSIIVPPPRPPYRHLPVHIPDTAEYLREICATEVP